MLAILTILALFAASLPSAHAFASLKRVSIGVASLQVMRQASALATQAEAQSCEDGDEETQKWDVERYQGQHGFVWEYGTSLVEILNPSPGERILDIGCGSGELTNQIASSVPLGKVYATGMDSSEGMIDKAKSQFPDVEFFVGDVRSFMVEEPYDAIFSNAALHWVPPTDAERAVQAMSRALKPGGRFVVEFGGKGNIGRIEAALVDFVGPSPWNFPSISEFSSLLEKNGIEVLSASLFDRPTPLENGNEGLKNWIRMFGNSFFEGKSDSEVNQLLDQIEDKVRIDLFDGNQWVADYRRIRIVGKKTG